MPNRDDILTEQKLDSGLFVKEGVSGLADKGDIAESGLIARGGAGLAARFESPLFGGKKSGLAAASGALLSDIDDPGRDGDEGDTVDEAAERPVKQLGTAAYRAVRSQKSAGGAARAPRGVAARGAKAPKSAARIEKGGIAPNAPAAGKTAATKQAQVAAKAKKAAQVAGAQKYLAKQAAHAGATGAKAARPAVRAAAQTAAKGAAAVGKAVARAGAALVKGIGSALAAIGPVGIGVVAVAAIVIVLFAAIAGKQSEAPQLGTMNEYEQAAAQFFFDKGLDDVHVAAIMGNIKAECGFDPAILETASDAGGIGIWQWPTKTAYAPGLDLMAYAAHSGRAWTDIQVQLEFAWCMYSGENNKHNVKDYAGGSQWMWNYERGCTEFLATNGIPRSPETRATTASRQPRAWKWPRRTSPGGCCAPRAGGPISSAAPSSRKST